MSRKTFHKLALMAELKLKRREEAKSWGGGRLSSEFSVAILFRMMAGATYLDIMVFGVAKSSVYYKFHKCVECLNETLGLPGIPPDETKLVELATGFKTSRVQNNPLLSCIGSIDGIELKICKPEDMQHPEQFFLSKGVLLAPDTGSG